MAVSTTKTLLACFVAAAVALGLGIALGHYGIPRVADTPSASAGDKQVLWDKLTSDGDPDISQKMMAEIEPENIKSNLR